MEELASELRVLGLDGGESGCRVELIPGDIAVANSQPGVVLHLGSSGLHAMDVVKSLQDEHHIAPKPPLLSENAVGFGPLCLRDGEPALVARAVDAIVKARGNESGRVAVLAEAVVTNQNL